MKLLPTRTYIIIKSPKELDNAKRNHLCMHIIYESSNSLYIWDRFRGKWKKSVYTMYGKLKEIDFETTGLRAYQEFYKYCGKSEIERMKGILSPIAVWDSYEQMHFANVEFAGTKIYGDIYEFDANNSFTYGATMLENGFEPLKEYMLLQHSYRINATSELEKSKYKNLQNYLVGYFARIKEFVAVRSNIIFNSNENIIKRMKEIRRNGGNVYLSNTDSIITDKLGSEVMQEYLGSDVGKFKLKTHTDRLFYNSSNSYQIGDKVVYSGVRYFARKHTDFFQDKIAEQDGSLVEGYDYDFEWQDEYYKNICRVREGKVTVKVYNRIGELVDIIYYKGVK